MSDRPELPDFEGDDHMATDMPSYAKDYPKPELLSRDQKIQAAAVAYRAYSDGVDRFADNQAALDVLELELDRFNAWMVLTDDEREEAQNIAREESAKKEEDSDDVSIFDESDFPGTRTD